MRATRRARFQRRPAARPPRRVVAYRTMQIVAEAAPGPDRFLRFGVAARIQHFVLMVTFITLTVTGLPQKFASQSWASWIIVHMGGIDNARLAHRVAAVMFILLGVWYVVALMVDIARNKFTPSMVPTIKDALDALAMLQYSLGMRADHPRFGRYEYRQKFEYWGIIFGTFVVISTGLVLWFPEIATSFLPGQIVPASREAHGGEATMAFLVIVTWHLWSVILSPVHFPIDTSIFTGYITKEKMLAEHPLEYAAIMGMTYEELDRWLPHHERSKEHTEAPGTAGEPPAD